MEYGKYIVFIPEMCILLFIVYSFLKLHLDRKKLRKEYEEKMRDFYRIFDYLDLIKIREFEVTQSDSNLLRLIDDVIEEKAKIYKRR